MTHSGGRKVPRHCHKSEEWVVPQWLGWSSHSLAYKSTQLSKTSHTTFHGLSACPLQWPTPYGPHPAESASLWILTNSPLMYRCVSNWIFSVRHQNLSFIRSWSQAQVPGERRWKMGGKSSRKNVPRNPLHNLLENLLNTWHVLTVCIGLILSTKIKDRRTPTGLGKSYWGPADNGAFGTCWGVDPARIPQLHPLPVACSQGVRGNEKQRL